jgi:hypothetical protein
MNDDAVNPFVAYGFKIIHFVNPAGQILYQIVSIDPIDFVPLTVFWHKFDV